MRRYMFENACLVISGMGYVLALDFNFKDYFKLSLPCETVASYILASIEHYT